MLKLGVSIVLMCCGVAHAASTPFPGDAGRLTVATPLYVSVDGEYRVCQQREGAKTLVVDGICVWESEVSAAELEHPDAVAGLVMERAATQSVNEYLTSEVGNDEVKAGRMREQAGMLVVEYQSAEPIFLSSQ